MKKILLATSALVGFAGAAAAEVSLSGYAEMGIKGANGGYDTQFHNDIDVTFNLSGETDGGLSFGATVDLDEVNSSASLGGTGSVNKSSVWISGAFGKLTMGDTDGALDWAVTEIYKGTSLVDDHSTHSGAYWNDGLDGTGNGLVARYEYSFGDFAVAGSAELDIGGGNDVLGLGVKWKGDFAGTKVGVGLGYQDNSVNTVWAISADAAMSNGFSANIGYADLDTNGTWAGIGLGYASGPLLVQANYGAYDNGGTTDGWGLVANYDLGGGAVVMAGYGSGDAVSGNSNGTDTWSVGLGLSF
ncbi:MAG: porin [Pseudorhodobacter sp.]|nr:porin [Pseudorhodobacter sp.]